MKQLLKLGLLALCTVAAVSAAPVSSGTFTFLGTCSDCPTTGNATLVVSPSGNTLNFNLTYTSDWLTYNMPSAGLFVNSGNGFAFFTGSSFEIGPSDQLYFAAD